VAAFLLRIAVGLAQILAPAAAAAPWFRGCGGSVLGANILIVHFCLVQIAAQNAKAEAGC